MKNIALLITCYCLSLVAYSQEKPPPDSFTTEWICKVSWFLPTDQIDSATRSQYIEILLEYCQKLKEAKKNTKNNTRFLQKAFCQIHKDFLGDYSLNSPLAKTFQNKKFDCVASSALFALVLEYMGYTYQIHETATHAYIKIQTPKGDILLETTNASEGFIKFPTEIIQLEQTYNSLLPRHNHVDFVPFNRIISLKELAGLQFYNQALAAMQDNNFNKGNVLLRKAKMLYYRSERVEKLMCLAGKL